MYTTNAQKDHYPPPPSSSAPDHSQQQPYFPGPPSSSPPAATPSFAPPPSNGAPSYRSEQPTPDQLRQPAASPPPSGGRVGYHPDPLHSNPSANGYQSANDEKAALARQMQSLQLAQAAAPGGMPQTAPATRSQFSFSNGQQALNDNAPGAMPGGAPAATHFVGAGATLDDVGTFNGGSYRVSHRDTNTIVTIQLAAGCPLTAKPGVMIAMSPTITLKGTMKFSMKKLVIGGEMSHSIFTGPGELLLAPPALGDVTLLRLTGQESTPWIVGKESYLASTQGIVKDYKAQSIAKGLFSGEGFFTYKMSGTGLIWMTSLGAIIRKDVSI